VIDGTKINRMKSNLDTPMMKGDEHIAEDTAVEKREGDTIGVQ